MFVGILASISLLWCVAAFAKGPSFDCNKAKTRVEKAICGDKDLSKMDLELAEIYKDSLNRLAGKERKAHKDSQTEWLRERNRLYGKLSGIDLIRGLRSEYTDRIVELIGDRDYPTSTAICLHSVEDVRRNDALMTIVAGSWRQA